MSNTDYVERIEGACVYDVAEKTPLEFAKNLSERFDNRIWLKREDLQPVFSFKLRGAYNKIASLPEEDVTAGVICASAGNHAQGVALAARRRGVRAVIVMPVTTPSIKVQAVEQRYEACGWLVVSASFGLRRTRGEVHELQLSKLDAIVVSGKHDVTTAIPLALVLAS